MSSPVAGSTQAMYRVAPMVSLRAAEMMALASAWTERHSSYRWPEGMSKARAFAGGVLSGVVEPLGAGLTILAAGLVLPALPYLLGFAAGAMLYVVVEELIPEMSQGEHSNVGVLSFALGFTLMMALDVALS